MTGIIIAFDGMDGCGKDTQIELVKKFLTENYGLHASVFAEPWRSPQSPCGMTIDRILRKEIEEIDPGDKKIDPIKLQKLYVCDRLLLWTLELLPRKEHGEIILLSRDRLSTMAFGNAFGISIAAINEWHRLIPQPDLYLYLNVTPEVSLRRINQRTVKGNGKIEYFEREEYARKIHQAFHQSYLAGDIDNLVCIAANGTVKEVAAIAEKVIGNFLESNYQRKDKKWLKRP